MLNYKTTIFIPYIFIHLKNLSCYSFTCQPSPFLDVYLDLVAGWFPAIPISNGCHREFLSLALMGLSFELYSTCIRVSQFTTFFEFLVRIFYFMQKCHENVWEKISGHLEVIWLPQKSSSTISLIFYRFVFRPLAVSLFNNSNVLSTTSKQHFGGFNEMKKNALPYLNYGWKCFGWYITLRRSRYLKINLSFLCCRTNQINQEK